MLFKIIITRVQQKLKKAIHKNKFKEHLFEITKSALQGKKNTNKNDDFFFACFYFILSSKIEKTLKNYFSTFSLKIWSSFTFFFWVQLIYVTNK